ncbi:Phage protein [Sporomusa ovata]|uniref:Phage protein n=2 Tax=Sporomusa ovata TaxID=2378 RepID=A0A0U1L5M2_9FIRM|nr:Phage protein [Sporomusa ovata]
MHELAELQLNHYLGKSDRNKFMQSFTEIKNNKFYSTEIYDAVQVYVDLVIETMNLARAKTPDATALIEQRLDFSDWVEGGFGTGDAVVVADGVLDIVDLKGGQGVKVLAEQNTQMMLYALGALTLFDSLYDIQTVRMTICQPRLDNISTYEISVVDLIHWAETELRLKAELAFNGEGEFAPGSHCRFCRARQTCRARAECHLELAKHDFKLPDLLADEEISEVLSKAEVIAAWVDDVRAYALTEAVKSGRQWPGFKIVEGRSNRKYVDEAKVAEVLLATGTYSESDIFTKDLLGITAMEKLLGKKQFNGLLGNFIQRPSGKPTLVPISDKRPEFNTAIADFKEEI